MARKKIREFTAKRLLQAHHKCLPSSFRSVQVRQDGPTLLEQSALAENAWLTQPDTLLVVKPDMLFGQRGKHDLVGLKLSLQGAHEFITQRMGKEIVISKKSHDSNDEEEKGDGHPHPASGISGHVTVFIVERFVPHAGEFYLSLESKRLETVLTLSHQGGVEIESNWAAAWTLRIPVGVTFAQLGEAPYKPTPEVYDLAKNFGGMAEADAVWQFVVATFRVFEELDFTMLEFNPFCFVQGDESGRLACIPLDMRGELDDQAAFKNQKKWQAGVDSANPQDFFPRVFGHKSSPAEDTVSALDAQTGASLKLTILNPNGKIWLLVAGGGASVIYTDTVCDLGHSALLGNYGEYSGNPTDDDTFTYAKTVLEVATAASTTVDNEKRCLVIGGGIANFTDVKATFRGICRALLLFGEKLRRSHFKIFVRRGGPNYEAALKMMKEVEAGVGVPVEIFGPETHMTRIVHLASEYILNKE